LNEKKYKSTILEKVKMKIVEKKVLLLVYMKKKFDLLSKVSYFILKNIENN